MPATGFDAGRTRCSRRPRPGVWPTTLVRDIADSRKSVYLDLENHNYVRRLSDPVRYLASHSESLVVLDEVQGVPDLFATLRGSIDDAMRGGSGNGRFPLLGPTSVAFLDQSGESLADRIACVELNPFDLLELSPPQTDRLCVRGGFPPSVLPKSDNARFIWRKGMIRTYLGRDIPQLGPRIAATTLRRFRTILGHSQGQILNLSRLARSLAVAGTTVNRYLDPLVDLR